MSRRERAGRALTRLANAAGWLAATAVIAFGGAGLVTALDHQPGTPLREELTWTAEQTVRSALDSLVADLGPLTDDFDELAAQGRTAIAALAAADSDSIDAAIDAGRAHVVRIAAETAALRKRVASLPETGPGQETRLGAATLSRISRVEKTLDTTAGTTTAWATLSIGGATASRLARLLEQHDVGTGEAVKQGSQGNYAAALRQLDAADLLLVEAALLRNQLANTADVAVLTQWLDRNAVIDAALRRLYTILVRSGGTVTDEARKAYDAVRLAQRQLPPDTRALVVIMAELARAGLNGAAIRIEETRGLLAAAVAGLAEPSEPPAEATPTEPPAGSEPSATPSNAPAVPAPSVTPPDA